jgi:Trypsin-like peptidase domain
MNQLTTIDEYIYFSVYDTATNKLLYTKYNFNFDKYKADKALTSLDKGEVFKHFLDLNGQDWTKPAYVKDELKQYFLPMTTAIIAYFNNYGWSFHDNYMQIKNPISNTSFYDIKKQQFQMLSYTDIQYRRLQDYFFTDESKNYYTKYNFNFELYQKEFEVWGTKLEVFTNFVIRCLSLGGAIFGTYGYGFYKDFGKYFYIDNDALIDYLVKYGVTSDYKNVYKNVHSIYYQGYIDGNSDLKLSKLTIPQAMQHYALYGQFERRVVPITKNPISPEENIIKSTCSIFTVNKTGGTELGSGFLYNNLDGTNNIYLVTCYHLNEGNPNINTIFASFEARDSNTMENTSTTALFRIIGYDIYSDILVGLFDPTLDYNVINKVDMSPFKSVTIDFNYNLKPTTAVYCVGNIGFENNKSIVEGTVIEPYYNGNFNTFNLPIPDSILIELHATKGFSGAPLFVKDENKNLVCIGMMNGTIDNYNQYSLAINGFFFNEIIDNIIRKWLTYSIVFADDIVKLNYYIKNGLTKRWLGVIASYYNYSLSGKKHPSLQNFPYTGGMVVSDFILGFNYNKRYYVTDPVKLSGQENFKIDTPLLKTKMYKRFIESGKNPIVIKSITFLDGIRSSFTKSYIGKYSNQVSYSRIMYGLTPMGNKFIEGFSSPTENYYPNLIIEYYYYNGQRWISETINVGGNTPDNYNIYADPLGYKYYQHQFEFPFTLIPYLKPYLKYNTTGAALGSTGISLGASIGAAVGAALDASTGASTGAVTGEGVPPSNFFMPYV